MACDGASGQVNVGVLENETPTETAQRIRERLVLMPIKPGADQAHQMLLWQAVRARQR